MSNSGDVILAPASKKRSVPVDALLRLAQDDIPREQARLRALVDGGITPSRLLVEMHGTLLDIDKEIARGLVEVRDWSYQYMNGISDHLEAIDARLDVIEEFGGDSALLPDDAEVLEKVIAGARYLATQMLQGPFPIGERDEEGKQKLAELIAFTEQAERIVKESVLVDDDDDDDEDDEESSDSDDDKAHPIVDGHEAPDGADDDDEGEEEQSSSGTN